MKRWFPYAKPRANAALRLFCLPYAGGGASIYRLWGNMFPESVEVWPVQPPGREMRYNEPAFTRAREYASALVTAIRPLLDRPFAFFGHSLGALMAFETTRALRAQGLPLPVRLFPSARRAPHLPHNAELVHALPEPQLIDHLRRLGGTPEEVLANAELRQLVLPVLRRDFELLETYEHQPEPPLDVPMRTFGGLGDTHAPAEALQAWGQHTRSFLGVRSFPGGHFYLHDGREPLIRAILEDLPR
jgi:surfactin synthase thioesterase subunit